MVKHETNEILGPIMSMNQIDDTDDCVVLELDDQPLNLCIRKRRNSMDVIDLTDWVLDLST